MVGPPGTGKSMLAQRFAGLLPPLSEAQALRVGGGAEPAPARSRPSAGASACCARRTTARRRRRWSAAARRRGRARSRSRTTACCFSTSCRSSRAPRSRRCASRSRPAASRSRAPRGRRSFRPAFQLVAAMNPCPCGHHRQPGARVPLHARRGRALPGPHQRAAARPHRPAGRGAGSAGAGAGCGGRRREQRRRWRGASQPARERAARRQGCTQRRARRRGGRRALRARRRRPMQFLHSRRRAARLVGAQLSPRAAHRAQRRRPCGRRSRSRSRTWPKRFQYRRVLQACLDRAPIAHQLPAASPLDCATRSVWPSTMTRAPTAAGC